MMFLQGPIHEYLRDGGEVSTIVLLLGLYRKVAIMGYQHKLIWSWFKREHNIESKNGDS